jgi:hypothetical protein
MRVIYIYAYIRKCYYYIINVFVHISPYIIWYDWTYLNTFSFEEIPWDSSGGANGLGTELLQQRWCQGGVAMLSSETTFTATVDNLRLKLEMVWLRQSWNILEHQCIPILNNVRWQATLSSTEHKQKDSWEQRWDNAELPNIRRNISAMYRFKSSLPPGWVKSYQENLRIVVLHGVTSLICVQSLAALAERICRRALLDSGESFVELMTLIQISHVEITSVGRCKAYVRQTNCIRQFKLHNPVA